MLKAQNGAMVSGSSHVCPLRKPQHLAVPKRLPPCKILRQPFEVILVSNGTVGGSLALPTVPAS
jgi:hypothetical protein